MTKILKINQNLLLAKSFPTPYNTIRYLQTKHLQISQQEAKSRNENFEHILSQISWFLDQRFGERLPLNESTQRNLEFICTTPILDTTNREVDGLDKRVMNSVTGGYLLSKKDILDKSIHDLNLYCLDMINLGGKSDAYYMGYILDGVTGDQMRNVIYYLFHVILSNQDTDNFESECSIVRIGILGGKMLIRNYFTKKCLEYRLENNFTSQDLPFYKWKEIWKEQDPVAANLFESDEFILSVGSKLIEIMERCELIKKVLIKNYNEQIQALKVLDTKVLKVSKRDINYPPTKLPMIVSPREYVYNNGKGYRGGYLLNEEEYSENMFIDKKAYKVSSYTKIENIVFNMVKGISSTPFKINKELFSFIRSGKLDLLLGEEHELEKVPNKRKYQKEKIKSHNSKYILQTTILAIADAFETVPEIYFPVRLDQRGRLYCEPQYFNYQSTELARALILFAKPSIINKSNLECAKYLKIIGANYFGLDKRSIQYKISWVDKNINDIINYENGKLVSKAKLKIHFLSFCMEYTKYHHFLLDDDMMEYKTYFPIQLDATCNGFQHMALLGSELELLPELNLVEDKRLSAGESNDFYSFILLRVKKGIACKLGSDSTDSSIIQSLERLEKFNLDRSIIKKAIMTMPYNSSHEKRRKYIENSLIRSDEWDSKNQVYWFWDGKNNDSYINSKDIDLLVTMIRHVIIEDHDRIGKLNKYLRNVATLMVKLNVPIMWNLPTGLVVSQSYLNKISTPISPFQYSKIKLNLVVTTDEFDGPKQVRSLMPNLIHSLDASSLCMLYDEFSKKFDNPQIYCVHDCFATTFDKVDTLKNILASIYTEVYISDNYLESFDNYILDQIEQTAYQFDRETRIVTLEDKKKYQLHSIDWVLNKKTLTSKQQLKIDSQFVLI